MQIVALPEDAGLVQQMAEVLVAGFREHWEAWETVDEALAEISEVRGKGFIRVALDDAGATVLGWIGKKSLHQFFHRSSNQRNCSWHHYATCHLA